MPRATAETKSATLQESAEQPAAHFHTATCRPDTAAADVDLRRKGRTKARARTDAKTLPNHVPAAPTRP